MQKRNAGKACAVIGRLCSDRAFEVNEFALKRQIRFDRVSLVLAQQAKHEKHWNASEQKYHVGYYTNASHGHRQSGNTRLINAIDRWTITAQKTANLRSVSGCADFYCTGRQEEKKCFTGKL